MKIDRSSEEYVRKAIKNVADRLKFYESNYAIKDKQDLLAMCLIEFATKIKSQSQNYKKVKAQRSKSGPKPKI